MRTALQSPYSPLLAPQAAPPAAPLSGAGPVRTVAQRAGASASGTSLPRKSLVERWLASRWSGWLSPLLLLGLWSVATYLEWMPEQILVSPLRVLQTGWEMTLSGELWDNLGVSLYRLFVGFGMGSLAGLVFGVLLGLSISLRAYVEPTFNVLRQLPTVALIPLFILVFGIGETFKVFIVIKATFFVVGLAVHDAVRALSSRYGEVAQIYCFTRWQVIRRIVLPSIIPATLTGVRIALSRAWLVLVGAELLAAESGLGQMMELGRQMFRLDIVMLGVVLTGVIGFSLDRGFRQLERHLMRWKRS